MREEQPERAREPITPGWGAGSRQLALLAVALLLLGISSELLNRESKQMHGVSLIWLPNALLLGVMLCSQGREWVRYAAVGFGVDVVMNLGLKMPPGVSIFLSGCNLAEVMLAYVLVSPAMRGRPDLGDARQMRRFLIFGVFLAPAVASWMAAWFLYGAHGVPTFESMRYWFVGDVLGMATVTPLYLSFVQRDRGFARSWVEVMALFLMLSLVSFGVFRLTTSSMLWLVMLALLTIGVRLGFRGSSMGLLMVTYIGGYLTMQGYGPLHAEPGTTLTGRIEAFQVFLSGSMLALYLTELGMSASRRVMKSLASSEIRFRSLAEASRDVIVLVDLRGNRRYVSPAMTELLGWKAEQLLDHTFGELAHPEDEEKVGHLLDELWAGKEPAPLAYRCRKRDRTYLWMEATARLLHDGQSGEPSGFVFVLRDIADRKIAEDALKEAFAKVEALAMQDGLTGVANRRLLDYTLEQEWLRGLRDGTPLSVVLIDVDHFKKYNDHYGHLAGDACLRRVATEVAAVLRRPPDLLARFGGEEFVAVLPNTPAAGAETVSEVLRRTVEECGVPHCGNSFGVLTVSLGCATVVPSTRTSVAALLKAADEALYEAKAGGRNQARRAPMEVLVHS